MLRHGVGLVIQYRNFNVEIAHKKNNIDTLIRRLHKTRSKALSIFKIVLAFTVFEWLRNYKYLKLDDRKGCTLKPRQLLRSKEKEHLMPLLKQL